MQVETTTTTTPPINQQKRTLLLMRLGALVILLIILYGLYWLVTGRFYESTDDAYVGGNLVQLMPRINGTVTTIEADDTHLVQENQPVVLLDTTDTTLALQKAAANLAQTVRQVRQLYQTEAQLSADVIVRKAQLVNSQSELKRRQSLIGSGAVSAEALQNTATQVASATARLAATQHQLAGTQALVENTTLDHYPSVEQAKAKLSEAYLAMMRTTILAPVTGYVAQRSVQVGQHVTPNSALLAIVPLNQIWVDANFKEAQLRRIRIGQPVSLVSDIYGSQVTYKGTVLGLSAGTGSVFSLLPPQNATGNWIKVVQRVPVRIGLDAQQVAKYPLRVGLSMTVSVDTHRQDGPALAQLANKQPIYTTNIYNNESSAAQALIDKIMRDNTGD